MLSRSEINLYVIVPVYGRWSDTLDCLRLLGAQRNRNFHVLIADDGSPEPPSRELRDFAFADYQRNPHRGFAGNCNAGAREACIRGATHLLFLNNDTVFSVDFIDGWLRKIVELPDAILSPNVYWFHRPHRVWYSGGPQSIWVPFFRLRRKYKELTPVDILCGCALVVPGHRWRELGGFNEDFVTYYEDFDFALRAKARGVRAYVAAEPDLSVLHKVARTTGGAGVWPKQYRLITSRLLFIRTHYRRAAKYLCFALVCVQLAVTLLLSLPKIPNPRLLWSAIVDGLTGPGGKQAVVREGPS